MNPGFTRADFITDLQGYWQFDGDGADSSGHGRELNLQGGIGFEAGLIGQALNFTGDPTKYAQRSTDDGVFDFGSGDFTIQAWVNYGAHDGEQLILEKFYGGRGPGWTLTRLPDSQIQFFALDYAIVNTEPLTISSEVWHHVVARRSGSAFSVFFDGQQHSYVDYPESFLDPVGSISDTSEGLLLGRRNLADGRGFSLTGKMDEVAIWTRSLSDAEVLSLWNEGAGRSVVATPDCGATLGSLGLGLVGLICLRRVSARVPNPLSPQT
jgi:hypothetical protein